MNPMLKVDILRAACCVAGIDGEVDDTERSVLAKLADDVGVGQASLEAMISRGKSDPEFHKEQFRVLKADPQETMATLLEVAMADGKLVESEEKVLQILSRKLDVQDEVFQQLIAKVNKMMG